MKKILIPAIFFLLSLISGELKGQNVQLLQTYVSDYPYITTSFKLNDSQGNEIRNFQTNDVLVNENSGQREVLSVDCPPQSMGNFTAVFSIDISPSMSEPLDGGMTRIDAVKTGLSFWFTVFDPRRTEIAITAFCGDAMARTDDPNNPPQTLTSDRDSLLLALTKIPPICAGTNYNAAFLGKRFERFVQNYSSLYWCHPDRAKYKPIIIFITDGNHLSEYGGPINGGSFNVSEVNRLAFEYGVSIYVIIMGTEPITPQNLTDVNQLAVMGKTPPDQTPNIWIAVNNTDTLQNILQEIFLEAGTIGDPPPCYLTWKAACDGSSATITFPNHGGVSDVVNYQINPDEKPELIISPDTIVFNNTNLSQSSTEEITITALKNFVEVEDIEFVKDNFGSDRLQITDWGSCGVPPFILAKDSSCKLLLQYTALDQNQTSAGIKFKSSACSEDTLTVSASPVTDVDNGNCTESGMRIIPNPADEYVNIVFPQNIKGTMKVIIFDVLGNVIAKKDFINFDNSLKLDIKSLTNGNYFIGCFSEGNNQIVPLVINR